MIVSSSPVMQALIQWEKHEKMNNLYVKRMQSVPCSLYSQGGVQLPKIRMNFIEKRGCGNRKPILMTFKRFNLSSTEQELEVIGSLGIYCWFVCASGVWKKSFPRAKHYHEFRTSLKRDSHEFRISLNRKVSPLKPSILTLFNSAFSVWLRCAIYNSDAITLKLWVLLLNSSSGIAVGAGPLFPLSIHFWRRPSSSCLILTENPGLIAVTSSSHECGLWMWMVFL